MKGKIPVERIIYNNYDLSDMFDDAKQYLIDEGNENPSDNDIWEEIYFMDSCNWEEEKSRLEKFFNDESYQWLLIGSVGRWNGVYHTGTVFKTFDDFFYDAARDCDYIKFYDENGHLYLTCSHHDGTCHYEIKAITDNGNKYLENWEDSFDDKRDEGYVHNQIFERYSKLPRFAEKVYGCPKTDYKPITRSGLVTRLNNQAKSFYC